MYISYAAFKNVCISYRKIHRIAGSYHVPIRHKTYKRPGHRQHSCSFCQCMSQVELKNKCFSYLILHLNIVIHVIVFWDKLIYNEMWLRKYIIILTLAETTEESTVVSCPGLVVRAHLLSVLSAVVDHVLALVRRWGCTWSRSRHGWNCGLYYNDLTHFVTLLFVQLFVWKRWTLLSIYFFYSFFNHFKVANYTLKCFSIQQNINW